MRRIIVVGASLAGHQAARCLRDLGYDGDLTVLGAEVHRPYDRYPLSKAYLTGDLERRGLEIEPRDLDVDWRLGQTATGLDLAGRYITIDGAYRAHFDGLVVATGSRPRLPFSIVAMSRACLYYGPSRTARRSGPLSRVEGRGWWSLAAG